MIERVLKPLGAVGAKVITFVPAHNEASGIRDTLTSLLGQTYATHIIVICDNCKDNTAEIARTVAKEFEEKKEEFKDRVEVIETEGNRFKKAGALNLAYEWFGGRIDEYDFVLAMDADTVLADDLVERALEEFSLNSKLGAVCSRAGVIKQNPRTFLEKLVYYWQHVEYGEFDRSRVGQHHNVKVSHGMCSVYSVAAIKAVMVMRKASDKTDCVVYDVHNITEDYELTVCIKKLGYAVAAGFSMYAWTDVPLSLTELWKQRVRWLRGGLDTLWEHGWHKATRVDILNSVYFWMMLMLQGILLDYTVVDMIKGTFHFNWMILVVMAIMYVDSVYTLRYVQDISIWDCLIRITLIPQLIYAWFTIAQQLYAYYLFIFLPNQDW